MAVYRNKSKFGANYPLMPARPTPCMMYLRKKMNRSRSGTVTRIVAAIWMPYCGSPLLVVKELRRAFVTRRQLGSVVVTRLGQT